MPIVVVHVSLLLQAPALMASLFYCSVHLLPLLDRVLHLETDSSASAARTPLCAAPTSSAPLPTVLSCLCVWVDGQLGVRCQFTAARIGENCADSLAAFSSVMGDAPDVLEQ